MSYSSMFQTHCHDCLTLLTKSLRSMVIKMWVHLRANVRSHALCWCANEETPEESDPVPAKYFECYLIKLQPFNLSLSARAIILCD